MVTPVEADTSIEAMPESATLTPAKRSRRRQQPLETIALDEAIAEADSAATAEVADLAQALAVPDGPTVPLFVPERLTADTTAVEAAAEPQVLNAPAAPSNGTHVAMTEMPVVVSTPSACQALTKSGRPCKNVALAGSPYCRIHQE